PTVPSNVRWMAPSVKSSVPFHFESPTTSVRAAPGTHPTRPLTSRSVVQAASIGAGTRNCCCRCISGASLAPPGGAEQLLEESVSATPERPQRDPDPADRLGCRHGGSLGGLPGRSGRAVPDGGRCHRPGGLHVRLQAVGE